MRNYKKEWFGNIRFDLLAGLVVCMALIPEVIGFTIVAGVDPMIGVYSSFCISVITAIFGGRTAMISAAAGSMALVLAGLVKSHGVQYMLAATILTGIIQVVLGYLKVGKLIKYIPRPVILGFVNALGILMFKSQLEHFKGAYILIVLGILSIGIIYLLPKITKRIPSPIVSIVIISAIVIIFNIDITRLGEMGAINSQLPKFLIPNIPLNLETLKIIMPYSVSLALVGLIESLLTAQIVDEKTESESNKNQESIGQGLANITAGFFGGIAGCGMIGQTVLNITYGGIGRLSTFSAGTFMLIFVIALNKLVVQVPVVALASVMIVVSLTTIDWQSIRRIKDMPISDTFVMLSTVAIVVLTDNLAYGVVLGVILSAVLFAFKSANIIVDKMSINGVTTYLVKGPLFFAATDKFINSFDYNEDINDVEIDFLESKIMDQSAVEAIDKVIAKFEKKGIKAKVRILNKECVKIFEKLSCSNNI